MLYEMHRPMLVQASSNYENGTISKDEFITSLKNISLQVTFSEKGTKITSQTLIQNFEFLFKFLS